MQHIVNNLWLGGQYDADELVHDNPEKITAILNVRGPDAYNPPGRDQSAEHPGKAYKYIPAPDIGTVYPRHVKEAVEWLGEQTGKGARILIHCKHGISRSPAFLAAFMVVSGISSNLEDAKILISQHRPVHPAAQLVDPATRVVLICALTGLPNRAAFDRGNTSPFVAIADVHHMRIFNEMYGQLSGDKLLCRLAYVLLGAKLDAYHDAGDKFLCKADSHQDGSQSDGSGPDGSKLDGSKSDLAAKLSEARQVFMRPFQLYANGHIQTIEGMDFSFGIGATLKEAESALHEAKRSALQNEPPEWLRRIIAMGGRGQVW